MRKIKITNFHQAAFVMAFLCFLSGCHVHQKDSPAEAAPLFRTATLPWTDRIENATPSRGVSGPANVGVSTGNGFTPLTVWGNVTNYFGPLQLGDVNGDRKIDLSNEAMPPFPASGIQIFWSLSTGRSFRTPTTWITLPQNNLETINWVADVDGDGKDDAIIRDANSGQLLVAKSNGNGFDAPVPWGMCSSGWAQVGDVNGDGKADLVCAERTPSGGIGPIDVAISNGTKWGTPTRWLDNSLTNIWGFVLADMDGDGKKDLILIMQSGPGVYVAYSSGSSFSQLWPWKFPEPPSAYYNFTFGDVNGDHRADIIIGLPDGIHVGINSGVDFVSAPQWHVAWPQKGPFRYQVADLNGDGKADILIFSQN